MKVVVNKCYGGFNISYLCYEYIRDKGGIPEKELPFIEQFIQHEIKDSVVAYYPQRNLRIKDRYSKDLYNTFEDFVNAYNNGNEECQVIPITIENIKKYPLILQGSVRIPFYPERHDPLLIEAIEVLGTEICSGNCACLKIEEISYTDYSISEYDGYECIEEEY